jgi:hypothetical protein
VAGDLEDLHLYDVQGHMGVRRAQERRLLGEMTAPATGLVRAREAVEEHVDVREGGVERG